MGASNSQNGEEKSDQGQKESSDFEAKNKKVQEMIKDQDPFEVNEYYHEYSFYPNKNLETMRKKANALRQGGSSVFTLDKELINDKQKLRDILHLEYEIDQPGKIKNITRLKETKRKKEDFIMLEYELVKNDQRELKCQRVEEPSVNREDLEKYEEMRRLRAEQRQMEEEKAYRDAVDHNIDAILNEDRKDKHKREDVNFNDSFSSGDERGDIIKKKKDELINKVEIDSDSDSIKPPPEKRVFKKEEDVWRDFHIDKRIVHTNKDGVLFRGIVKEQDPFWNGDNRGERLFVKKVVWG